ncbi:4'-phosphopantetheinyl transferase family protein [Edaphobacter dinghuensis]|uniref:4'-phosphopantetheinyl transferase family protein n=1 Tax=Edaphobacter dinghuensis TaxID=1560005 RepID=UPI003570BA19
MNAHYLARQICKLQIPFESGSVHVWSAAVPLLAPILNDPESLLSREELDRVDRFRPSGKKQEFLVGRALLRMILGSYCGIRPASVMFCYGHQGKPSVASTPHTSRRIAFNISHSIDIIVIAICEGEEIGVDVECLNYLGDVTPICMDILAEAEVGDVLALEVQQRRHAFCRYWVHKEAFLKQMGCGLSIAPRDVQVSFEGPGRSEISCPGHHPRRRIFGLEFPTAEGYVAALATPVQNVVARLFDVGAALH